MDNFDLDKQAQILTDKYTPHQLAKKYLLAQDLIAFLGDNVPNLDVLIDLYEEENK